MKDVRKTPFHYEFSAWEKNYREYVARARYDNNREAEGKGAPIVNQAHEQGSYDKRDPYKQDRVGISGELVACHAFDVPPWLSTVYKDEVDIFVQRHPVEIKATVHKEGQLVFANPHKFNLQIVVLVSQVYPKDDSIYRLSGWTTNAVYVKYQIKFDPKNPGQFWKILSKPDPKLKDEPEKRDDPKHRIGAGNSLMLFTKLFPMEDLFTVIDMEDAFKEFIALGNDLLRAGAYENFMAKLGHPTSWQREAWNDQID